MAADSARLLEALLEIGVNLSAIPDRRRMLDMILAEARRLARAEGGSLYVVRRGQLEFVAAQNDRLPPGALSDLFLGKTIPMSDASLAGFVASTVQVVNIPDADRLSPQWPFRINRDFDATSGYHTQSILAIPLRRPEGRCVGVLELINRLDDDGRVTPFPQAESTGILSLASMAAVTIHNALLQEDLKQAHLDTIIRLSVVVEHRDNATAQHIRRMSHTAGVLARAAGLDAHEVELVESAAPMHDIGKVGIPDAILHKPSALTPDERQAMQQHTFIGADILRHPTSELLAMAHDIAISHHERWDGRGYPNRLAGGEIPLCGRIAALADASDAILSERCYKEAITPERMLHIIREESGLHFDPTLVDAFFDRADEILAPYLQADDETAAR
jgi:HD-GYP domain-containing protein (c-di-GMP phosphodiesterase class II)